MIEVYLLITGFICLGFSGVIKILKQENHLL